LEEEANKTKVGFPKSGRKEQSTTQDKNEKKNQGENKTNSRPTHDRPRTSRTNQNDPSRPIENNQDQQCDKNNGQVGHFGWLPFQAVDPAIISNW
jgi:hypothetical protein